MAQAQIRLQQANFIQNATRTRYRIISEIQHICETRGTEPSTKLDIEWRKEPHCRTAQITQNSTKFVNNKPISLRMLPVSVSLQISKASEKLEEQSQAQNELDTPTTAPTTERYKSCAKLSQFRQTTSQFHSATRECVIPEMLKSICDKKNRTKHQVRHRRSKASQFIVGSVQKRFLWGAPNGNTSKTMNSLQVPSQYYRSAESTKTKI